MQFIMPVCREKTRLLTYETHSLFHYEILEAWGGEWNGALLSGSPESHGEKDARTKNKCIRKKVARTDEAERNKFARNAQSVASQLQ